MQNSNDGIGFAGLLAIVFIALKLTKVIDWNWIWVLAPLWVGLAIVAVVALICLIFAFFIGKSKKPIKKVKRSW